LLLFLPACYCDLEDTMGEVAPAAIGASIVAVVSAIMLASSFSVITPHELGIHYRGPEFTLDHKVWNNGRHFLGLGHSFFKYPKKYEYVEYSNYADGGILNKPITCWTKSGQELIIEVGFYYQLDEDSLLDLFYVYKADYLPTLEKIARHAIRDTTTTFATLEFFESRAAIQEAMFDEVNFRLKANCFARVPLLNILTIDVPDLFEQSVIEKIMVAQEVHTLTMRKKTEEIRSNIGVIDADARKEIAIINAQAQAKGRIMEAEAKAEAAKNVLVNEASLYRSLGNKLGLICANATDPANAAMSNLCGATDAPTDATALLQYMWIGTYRDKAGARVVVGMEEQ